MPQMWFNFVPVLTDPDCIMVCREGGDAPVRETIYIVDYILYVVHVPSYIPCTYRALARAPNVHGEPELTLSVDV